MKTLKEQSTALKNHSKHDKIKQDLVTELRSQPKVTTDSTMDKKEETEDHVQVPTVQVPKEVGQGAGIAPTSVQEELMLVGEKKVEKEDQRTKQEEGEEVKQTEGKKEKAEVEQPEGKKEKVEVVMVKEEIKNGEDSGEKNKVGEEEKISKQQEVEEIEIYDSSIELDSILRRAPVIIFSKTYCPYSAAAKHILLEEFKLTPGPYIVELDLHPHGKELQEFLKEKTGRSTVPNVFVSGRSLGGADELKELLNERELGPLLKRMGGKRLRVEQKNLEQ